MKRDKNGPLSLDEAGGALAGLCVVLGDNVATDLVARLKRHRDAPPMTPGGQAQVRLHLLLLCYFWSDRTAFSTLGMVRRDSLMDIAHERFVDLLASAGSGIKPDDRPFRKALSGLIDAALARWSQMPIVPASGSGPKGTLFWEFGKEVAELIGRPMDAEVVSMTMMIASKCVKVLDPSQVLKRVNWPSDN